MSDSHDGEQPPRSPHHDPYDHYTTAQICNLSTQTSSCLPTAFATSIDAAPDPEFNEYANKQSAKVNEGLVYGGPTEYENEEGVTKTAAVKSLLSTNAFAVDVDFSTLEVPGDTSPPAHLPVEDLVRISLGPPPHAFRYGVLSVQWILGAIGRSHFTFRAGDERYVLKLNSSVRTEGKRLGLPDMYLEWLCGDGDGASPTEQSMLLTKQYFEEIRKGVKSSESEPEVGR